MISKDRLNQFYYLQYQEDGKRKKLNKKKAEAYRKNILNLMKDFHHQLISQSAKKLSTQKVEEFHRRLAHLGRAIFKEAHPVEEAYFKDFLIPALVKVDLMCISSQEKNDIDMAFLKFLKKYRSGKICSRSMAVMYKDYVNYAVEKEIVRRVPERPEMEFSATRQMHRHFILHVGPTNSGKTYHALERLRLCQSGVYLGPLRLLALEVYENMNHAGIACTMLTGEECLYMPESKIIASTIEMLDITSEYDVAVIDEAQMIADPERGQSWTRAILGVRAKEIHVCMSMAALNVIEHLIDLCDDSYEVHQYHRMCPLVCESTPFSFPEDIQKGDALIVFSKKAVLDVAGRLESEGIKASVVYGSLPPEIRRKQIELFHSGRTKVVVSTDAIGMGLNLPVRRIVFMRTEKYDGREMRPLLVSEILQIAGRAGRFGVYDQGFVTAIDPKALSTIESACMMQEAEIDHVTLGFPQVLLEMNESLKTILTIWKSVVPEKPFEKINIENILYLYDMASMIQKNIDGFDDKVTLYRMLTCPIDVKNKNILNLWLHYCQTYTADTSLDFPELYQSKDFGLQKYETYYQMLDLYYQFSYRMGKEIDVKRLESAREKTGDKIMNILIRDKKDYIKRCRYCGCILDVNQLSWVCKDCRLEQHMHYFDF